MEIKGNLINVKESEFKRRASKDARHASSEQSKWTNKKVETKLNGNVDVKLYKDVLKSDNKELNLKKGLNHDGRSHAKEEKMQIVKGEFGKRKWIG